MAKLTLILTDDRQRALAVLLTADQAAQPVYASNATSDPGEADGRDLTIRQRTVDWLRVGGYVTTTESSADQPVPDGSRVLPTDRGLRLARQAATGWDAAPAPNPPNPDVGGAAADAGAPTQVRR